MAVGELVGFFERGGLGGGLHFLVKVEGDVAELLLDVTDDFALGGGGEWIAALHEDLDKVVGQITSGQVQPEDGVREGETFVNGDGVRDAVTGVEDDTGGATGGVEGEYGLNGDVERGGIEGLEHDLGHLLPVGLWVQWGLGEQDGVLLGSDTEFIVEGVMPDLLHIVPVGDDTVFDGVLEGEDTSLGLGLIADDENSA